MRTRTSAAIFLLITLATGEGVAVAQAGTTPRTGYSTAQVVGRTVRHPHCVEFRSTPEGRIMYRDLVTDQYDDIRGVYRRRTLTEQIRYVRSGCRNG